MEQREKLRIARSTLHNHLRTTNYITKKTANKAVETATKRLGSGGVFGVISFDSSPTEIDERWQIFLDNLRYDKVLTGNGVYIPEKDILAVNGQEVPTMEGYHILVIGTTPKQNITNGLPLEMILDRADEFGAIKLADHPFYLHGLGEFLKKNPELNKRLDGHETYNGVASLPFPRAINANKKAQEYFDLIKGQYQHLIESSSDDGHSCYELGKSYSIIKMPKDYMQFKDDAGKVISVLREGYRMNRAESLGSKRTPAKTGALDHLIDLIALIKLQNWLGWDPNRKTAPLFEKFGISI